MKIIVRTAFILLVSTQGYSQTPCTGGGRNPMDGKALLEKTQKRAVVFQEHSKWGTDAYVKNQWKDALYYFQLAKEDAESFCSEAFETAWIKNEYHYVLIMIVDTQYRSGVLCPEVVKSFNYAQQKGFRTPSWIEEWNNKLKCDYTYGYKP